MKVWCWTKFITGLLNKQFVAWLLSTIFVREFVHNGQSDDVKKYFIVAWGAMSIIWMLSHAFKKFVANGKLNVELKK